VGILGLGRDDPDHRPSLYRQAELTNSILSGAVPVVAWVVDCPSHIIVSGKMIGLRPNLSRAVPMMLSAALASKETQAFLDQRTTGMAESQVNFANEVLLSAPIRLPQIEEQHALASILTDMDAELAALQAKLAKTRQLKRGMMH